MCCTSAQLLLYQADGISSTVYIVFSPFVPVAPEFPEEAAAGEAEHVSS